MKTVFKKKNLKAKISQGYRTIGVFLMLALTLFSCSDPLEEEVYDAFTGDGFFNSVTSAEQGMWGIYDKIASRDLFAERFFLFFQQGSDHARYWRVNRGNDDDFLCNYQIQENNREINEAWKGLYQAVYRANLVIDQVTLLRDGLAGKSNLSKPEAENLAAYNNVLGDAHFLRGFVYFQLIKNWGGVPLRLSSNVSLSNLKSERAPLVDVYKQIEKDILYAISLLPPASETRSPGRVSKGAAQGMMSRVYLHWAGFPLNDTSKFPEAAKQALAVMQSGQHQLNTNIEKLTVGAPFDGYFPDVFHNLAKNIYESKESMWEIHYSYPGDTNDNASVVGVWHGIRSNTSSIYKRGGPRWYPLPSFYHSFKENDSIRRDWSIARFEIDANANFVELTEDSRAPRAPNWGVGKFRRYLIPNLSPENNFESMNWPVIRYADVLLMFAEGVNESVLNGETLPAGATMQMAYDAVNQVRRRAMGMFSPNSEIDLVGAGGEEFRQQIRDERSWELCFERTRKSDLIRWGILGDVIAQTSLAMDDLGFTHEEAYFQADNFEPKHVLLPIPYAAEISQNPDVLNTDPTNNGYR
ncbi:RagB/SusD family nutrient uptake outer membrane protein [Aestuariivivens insulae]|uniref:RagB/SusD family nutrient uptake outer membrane protein n=1 Tax=Aestuariivivens insulae TaxID=1621988 RepID=UPI001F585F15|nr:RagB/SusD family nutrient uptake outer membrane protein [Aestuariivivens insulae]